jgi:ketosteroid isomerase-like protein
MNKLLSLSILFFVVLLACSTNTSDQQLFSWMNEIRKAEADFAEMVKNEGIHDAFLAFAADDAVLMRDNKLIIGKLQIDQSLAGRNAKTLTWSPDFVDVSSSGDMGYTYGTFVFTATDSLGNTVENTGVFHTVWKRQDDGSWKFVWD